MVSTPFIIVVIISLLTFSSCLCFVLPTSNSTGLATWYGNETGPGSGAACGWEDDVKDPPLSSMISAGNANIFLKGKGCGNCFEIFCTQPPHCSGKPITVTISDECPGYCNKVPFHFDLSGFAFGKMANPGQEQNLRKLGQVDVQYKRGMLGFGRVPCSYGSTKIAFKVSQKSNPNWFAMAIEYANGDGGFGHVEIAAGGTQNYSAMDNIWGAVWKKDIAPSYKPPFSFRLTSADGKTLVATNVIPLNFAPGQKYSSTVNF
ncbi:expansin-B15-like [Cynara cardunculus var. scolymus]|uniref:expansin-B15-like n=1 Tax=Cynara cardunculus var. scolymus TaxID=59895 RepID=UPI000D62574C|nr:expansin-B15-like [Cynara cardunculus var. scolymus]